MHVPPFELERWQSIWENRVELNISESGVDPLTLQELVPDPEELQRILHTPLAYPQGNGGEKLRANVAQLYPGARFDNVLVTTGCAEANYLITWNLIEPGDEVVFMQPNYMQIAGAAQGFRATVKPLWLREELRWAPDLDELRRLVTPKTKLIAICNPNNPTGAVLSAQVIDDICEIAGKAGAWLLADEVYRGAEFEGGLSPTFWGRYERVLCTAGLSKAYSLPGLRTGWVVGPAEFVEKLWGYKDYTTIGASMLSDRLATLALGPERRAFIRRRVRQVLHRNYPVLSDWIRKQGQALAHVPPAAGAIAWIRYSGHPPSCQLVEELRLRQGVLLCPGSHFAMEPFFRIGFGGNLQQLQMALERIEQVLTRAVAA